MKNEEFLLIHKSALPEFYEQVVKAVRDIKNDKKSITDVCREYNISRSTFYKYKDKVFEISKDYGRKAIISFKVEDERGVLSSIINEISEQKGNILTINQDMPIHRLAYITITLDTQDISISIFELIRKLREMKYINDVSLVALE